MIDMQGTDGREPIADLRVLLNELKLYKPGLVRKPILVASTRWTNRTPVGLSSFRKGQRAGLSDFLSDEGFDALKQALLDAVLKCALRSRHQRGRSRRRGLVMDAEETQAIELLLGTDSTLAQQKAGLTRLGEMLEESYSQSTAVAENLDALAKYARTSKADKTLKARAKRLCDQYKLR